MRSTAVRKDKTHVTHSQHSVADSCCRQLSQSCQLSSYVWDLVARQWWPMVATQWPSYLTWLLPEYLSRPFWKLWVVTIWWVKDKLLVYTTVRTPRTLLPTVASNCCRQLSSNFHSKFNFALFQLTCSAPSALRGRRAPIEVLLAPLFVQFPDAGAFLSQLGHSVAKFR